MNLTALAFPIDYDSFHVFLLNNVPNADGICSTTDGYQIIEKNPFTSNDITAVTNYYNSLTQAGESAKLTMTPLEYVMSAITAAAIFGNDLTVEYASSNVLQGITQAGKTQDVADYLKSVAYYLHNGSLYAAIDEINSMIADTSDDKAACAPFVTNDILYTYLNKVQTYLKIALTTNPGT